MDVAGVDLLFAENGFKVCEVNSAPGFIGLEKVVGAVVAESIIDYILLKNWCSTIKGLYIMSHHTDCIFCKILRQEIPAEIIASNDHVFVIKDRAPKAPFHFLIIPKNIFLIFLL